MTPTTETVRTKGFLPVESDIPADLTIEQYRAGRPPREPRRCGSGRKTASTRTPSASRSRCAL